jgi:hypothetical protein
MSTQEIQDYKLKWLRTKCFRVNVIETNGEHHEWLEKNLHEKTWEMSFNPDNKHHTFYFEKQQDAEKFRENFHGDSRTNDFIE